MTTPTDPRGILSTPTGAEHARIMGVGGYRPERVVPNSEIVEPDRLLRRVDPRALRHRLPPLRRPGRVGRRHVRGGRPRGARRRRPRAVADRRRHRRHRHPPLPDPGRGTAWSPTGSASSGAAFDISAACAGYCHGIALANDMVRGGSAEYVLVIGVEKLSDFTDPTDRGIGVHLRRRRRRGRRRPVRHPRHRPDRVGLGRRAVEDHLASATRWVDDARRRQRRAAGRRIAHGRARPSSAGPCGAWRRSPSRRWTPPASRPTTSTPSSPTRPTCGSSTR